MRINKPIESRNPEVYAVSPASVELANPVDSTHSSAVCERDCGSVSAISTVSTAACIVKLHVKPK